MGVSLRLGMGGGRSRERKVMVPVFCQEEEGDEEERGGVGWRGGRKGPVPFLRKCPSFSPFFGLLVNCSVN